MQLVSENYKKSMKSSIREQSFIKISFLIEDQEASDNVTLVANSTESYSDLDNTNKGYEVENTYITMEKGRYTVGTDQIIYDGTDTLIQGYVSDVVADNNGEFHENPVITVTSSIPLNTLGFTFDFDNVCNEYPLEIRIKAYLESVLVSDKVFGISKAETSLYNPIEAWDKVEIEWIKVLPYHRARLDNLIFGYLKVFENDVVINATMTRQCSPISNEIAQNSFKFEIENFNQAYNPDNPDNIYQYVEEEQEIEVQFGYPVGHRIEWVNGGKYMLDGMPTINQYTVSFNAVDTLGDLTDIYYKGMYRDTPISMYDLAEMVLIDAGLKSTEYVLDDYMKTVFTKAPLPVVSHKECLQIIANACQCLLFVNREGQITFDVAVDPKITISDNGGTYYSSSANAYNIPDLITETFITAEKDFWHVGDNMVIENTEDWQGFTSDELSDENGLFTVNPQIVIEYSIGISLYEIPITFGGTVYDFNVHYYSGDTLVDTFSVTNNEELEYTVYSQENEITKVVYEVVRVKPYQRARINRIGTGRVSDFYLDFYTSKTVPVVKKQSPLYAVDVKCYSWSVGENKEIFKETVEVNGSITLKVEYNASKNIVVNTSSGFSAESEIYTQYAIIIITGNGSCDLLITGDELVESNMIVSNVVGLKGETKTLENPLITDTTNAQTTAKWIADWLTKRNEYDIEYRGNPEVDAYDMIYAQSLFEQYFPVRVVKNEVTFNGALQGKMNARRT